MQEIPRQEGDRYRTRTSLLQHVRDLGNELKWQQFYDTYSDLIFSAAWRSGLAPADAEDLTQEIFIELARLMPRFQYDRSHGSFRGWLLRRVSWRIKDHFRKRSPTVNIFGTEPSKNSEAALDQLPDTALEGKLEEFWDTAWRQAVARLALHNIQERSKISERHFQILDLLLVRGQSPAAVAKRLEVKRSLVDTVYSRIRPRLEEEIARLREEPI